ncbi:uncharacterized protein OCT59_000067 [Rhizophagus irregularis]|uniref:uncharacterized protein n=1 Tax=Rhizophagus irregularis TaxID=588596 RepID=UPI0019FEDBD0|nr:hypothetical protein OCT59_000067 [Rhizophagus irregularis]GET67144.1 hypothetical protein GLOIN_2v1874618 [Rhizophagus irregularis DAOM 181602=DAOM 197198]
MIRITHSKSYNSNKTNNTTSKNKTIHKRQRISNSTIEESNNAHNDLLDDPPLDEFIMDINIPHNSTSFNNESLEESDKSPIKKSNSNVTDKSENAFCITNLILT